MVWGLCLPNGFGDFWPKGSFENGNSKGGRKWSDRLREYYCAQPLEIQKDLFGGIAAEYGEGYPLYVSKKFTQEIGSKVYDYPPLNKIKAHEPPQFLQTDIGYKSLGSLIQCNSMIVAVDEDLKSIIENLEGGTHEFFEMEIRMPRNQIYPKKFFTLRVGNYFDSFSPEESKKSSYFEPDPGRFNVGTSKKDLSALSFKGSVFGGAHMWRERRIGPDLTCFSDVLHDAIVGAGLRMPGKFFPMKESS